MKKRKILIRFDDLCPEMNKETFSRAFSILESYNLTALLGVVPDCKDPNLNQSRENIDFWDEVKELEKKGYKIAMHGCNHIQDINEKGAKSKKKLNSEFAGHKYNEQYRRIKLGKKILLEHGINTDVFFAPSHSFDNNTLKALKNNGYKYMSDGYSLKPFRRYGVICIPCRSRGIPKIKKSGYYTAVFHPGEWKRKDKLNDYREFKRFCERYHEDIVNPDEYINRNTGIFIFNYIDGIIYKKYIEYIKPKLSYIKHTILRMN